MSGRRLSPGTYGTVCVRPETTRRGEPCGTYAAQAWTASHDGKRAKIGRNGKTSDQAERRLREHLHSLGLRDARNGGVTVGEHVTEAEGPHDGENVQAGNLDALLCTVTTDDLAELLNVRRDVQRVERELNTARRHLADMEAQHRQASEAQRVILDRIKQGAA